MANLTPPPTLRQLPIHGITQSERTADYGGWLAAEGWAKSVLHLDRVMRRLPLRSPMGR